MPEVIEIVMGEGTIDILMGDGVVEVKTEDGRVVRITLGEF